VTVPNYLLAQAAAQVADVVLNGEGGDPCFGGPKNLPMLLARLYGPLPGDPPTGWLERNYLRAFQRGYQDLGVLLDPALAAGSRWRCRPGQPAGTVFPGSATAGFRQQADEHEYPAQGR
jgi:asparagine synthetase B (glutamine-hydrolysing)